MAIQLEDLVARVRLDTSGVDSGMGAVSSSINRAGAGLSSAGRRMTVGITAPLVGIGVAGVKMAADFDLTMRRVAIATGGPTKALSDLALQMGKDTAFSAQDASDAMLELAKGGMTAAQIQGGVLQSTMKLAAAGDVALGDSATYVSNAMQTFGLKAGDANRITTALAGAANASSASVESLGQGLAQGGLAARNAGLNLNQTVGVLSEFDAAGLKGADAGTSLKAAMNSLIPTTDKAQNAMDAVGLSFVDAHGNFAGLGDIAGQLHDKLGPLSEAQRQLTLETIFGSDGMRAATILMNGGRDAVDKYTKATKDQKTTNELANAAMSGLSGSIERAKGSLETAALTIGQVLAPYVEKLAGFVEQAANAFTSLPGPLQGVAVVVGIVAAAMGPLLLLLGGIVTGLAVISAPVALVVIGLGALVAALIAVYTHSATFRAVVAQAFAGLIQVWQTSVLPGIAQIRTAFMGLVAVVVPIVRQIVGVVTSQMPQIRATVSSVFASVRSIIVSAMSIIESVVRIATTVIRTVWQAAGNNILSIIRIAMTTVQGVIRGAFTIIQGIFQTAAAILKGDWSGAWDGIKTILRGAWTVITSILRGAVGIFVEVLKGGVKLAVAAIKALPGLIVGALAGLGGMLAAAGADMIRGLIGGIKSMAGAAADAAISVVKGALDGAKSFLHIGSPSKTFRDEVGKMIGKGLIEGIVGTKDEVRAAMHDLLEAVKKTSREGLIEIVSDAQDRLLKLAGRYERVTDRLETIKDRLKTLRDQAASLADQVKNTIVATGDISGVTGATDDEGNVLPVTFAQIMDAKTAAADQAVAFAKVIAELRTMGLSEDQVQTLLAKGPEALEVAQAMTSAGAAGIAALNGLQEQIVATGTSVGAQASEAMYGSGIDAAEGLIQGLKQRENAIARQMRHIARMMVRAIRDALDMHSPSGVFRGLGRLTGTGLVLGLNDQVAAVARASADLLSAASVAVPRVNTPPIPGTYGRSDPAVAVAVYIGNEEFNGHIETQVGRTLAPLRVAQRQGAM